MDQVEMLKCLASPCFCPVFQVATPSIHASRTSRRKTCASNISRSPRVMGVFWAIANHRGNEYAQQAGIEGGAQGFPFSFFLKNMSTCLKLSFYSPPGCPQRSTRRFSFQVSYLRGSSTCHSPCTSAIWNPFSGH